MEKEIKALEDFNDKFGYPYNVKPQMPSMKARELRIKLLREELKETENALWEGDFIESVDGLVDQLYVLLGLAHDLGVANKLSELFAEVHRSNMSKLGKDGKPIYRSDGKILKGKNYSKPQLESIIWPDFYD